MTRLSPALGRSSSFLLVTLLSAPCVLAQENATPFYGAQIVNGIYDRFDATVDLDLDGDPDFLGSWASSSNSPTKVKWYRNDGTGRIDGGAEIFSGSGHPDYVQFLVADFDGDGNDDVVIAGGGFLRPIFARKGAPVFGTAGAITPLQNYAAVAGDVTGDGQADIVLRDSRTTTRIRAYTFDRTKKIFTEIATLYTGVKDLALANVDKDPQLEIVLHNKGTLFTFNVASGSITSAGVLVTGWTQDLLIASGDVDGDKDRDLVVFRELYGDYIVYRHDGTKLVAGAKQKGGPATHLADVDKDGDLDGLCCGGGGGPYPYYNHGAATFMVSLNDGKGNFAPAFPIAGMGARHLAGCVDVDKDGDQDLVAGRCIIFNTGDIRDNTQPGGASQGGRSAELYDVNGDGDLDANLGGTTGSVAYLGNRGDGTFRRDYVGWGGTSGKWRSPLASGDFDGDGDPDALVEDLTDTVYQVRLLPNHAGYFFTSKLAAKSGVRFSQKSKFSGGNGTVWPNHWHITGDLDSDGDLDVVIMDETNKVSALWRNDGKGYFTAGPTLPAGTMVLRIADLNGDKKADLLAGIAGKRDGLSILFATSTGFSAPVGLTARRDERPGIGDLDGDGDLDIITSTAGGGQILRNNGKGAFQSEPIDFHSGTGQAIFRCRDLNADGRMDIVCSWPFYHGGRTTTVAMQQKDGKFATTQIVAAPASIGDIDQDGDLDLVGSPTIVSKVTPKGIGSTRQFGHAIGGMGNYVPVMSSVGILKAGNRVHTKIRWVRGGALGFYYVGFKDTIYRHPGFPYHILYVDPSFPIGMVVADGTPNTPAGGSVRIWWDVPAYLPGVKIYTQAFFVDADAPGGLSQTNPIEKTMPSR